MISDEVRMLINRMETNPHEFTAGQVEFGDRYQVRESRRWDSLMDSIVNNKPDLEILFTAEEIKALRNTASKMLRPIGLGSIVKQIVGGEEKQLQMELAYEHPYNASDVDKLQVQLIRQYLEKQNQQ